MAFDNRIKSDPNNQQQNLREYFSREGNPVLPPIIQQNPQTPSGKRQRELIRWRVPGLGFVQQYINPQSFIISDSKIITKQITKGGFVIQYFAENLTTIKISGHTGSSGVEGIEILRRVYRAEQEAFLQVEQEMKDRLNKLTTGNTLSGIANDIQNKGLGAAIGGLVSDALGGSQVPPILPTLGSLANGVELYYQGWVFKGFFESFSVTESVGNGPGVFNYELSFTATSRRGYRENFMPWHRSPILGGSLTGDVSNYNQSDSNSTPMSFGSEEE